MRRTSYLIALGSNRRHVRHGAPAQVLDAAVKSMEGAGLAVRALSSVHHTAAVGPAGRDFANAVARIDTHLDPPALLRLLKSLERSFGPRSVRRWGPRVLDLDILLWSGGVWPSRLRWRKARGLVVPHRAMAERAFVLEPALEAGPEWRNPMLGKTIRQLAFRLKRKA